MRFPSGILLTTMSNVKVRLLHPDLINIYGSTKEVPYNWAMSKIKAGMAVLYHDPPTNIPPPKINANNNYNNNDAASNRNNRKYPEIVWVQDNNMMGGAELSSKQVMAVGERLGFHPCMLTPQSFDLNTLRNAKLLIINNIFTFNTTQMAEIKRAIFEFQVPYIKYEHDMRELYDDRLSFSRRLYKHSRFNVFISPGQLERYQAQVYDMSPSYTFPLAIDVDEFTPNRQIKRIPGKVVHTSGNLHNKGAAILLGMVRTHKDKQFDIFPGDNKAIMQMFSGLPNVTLKPRVGHDKMRDVYSEAEYLAHVPTGYWAGERVVLEAALCGCKLIINDNVGHKSWGWDLADVAALKGKLQAAPYDFWRAVDGVMH